MLRTVEEAMSQAINWWGDLPPPMKEAIEQFRTQLGAAIAAAGPQSSLGFWERGAQNRGKEGHLVDARRQLSDELFQAVVQ